VNESVAQVPFEQVALDAGEVGVMLGQERRYVLERLATRPDFPRPCSLPGQQKRWLAGEIIQWREVNRACPPVRRRSRCSTAAMRKGSDAR
jgi:predicted DNA-binding transcriptional regulator AlpA